MKKITMPFFVVLFLYLIVLLIIFKAWFIFTPLTGGDWEYFFPSAIEKFPFFPHAWNSSFGLGFGGNQTFFMVPNSFFTSTSVVFYKLFGFEWEVIERLVWFYPYLIISSVAAYVMFRTVFIESRFKNYAIISACIYVCNTYALMIVGGGQMGVGMAYAFLPLVISLFIKLTRVTRIQEIFYRSLIFSFVFSLLLLFDVRVYYITWIIIVLYFFVFVLKQIGFSHIKKIGIGLWFYFVFPIFITLLLHSWWIVPFFMSSISPLANLSSDYLSSDTLSFYSFASFSNGLSLLQPNWPDNIFGKTAFLRPEFLVLPLVAFSSLLFLQMKKSVHSIYEKQAVLFFICLGIGGVFLAKGVNEPFGPSYTFLFNMLPGFFMFRDPSKWYILIALSYSILIPFTLFSVCSYLQKFKRRNIFQVLLFVSLSIFFVYLFYPAFSGQLRGTFATKTIPSEYLALSDMLGRDTSESRVLWVPKRSRFGYVSEMHPSINATDLFHTHDPKLLLHTLLDRKTFDQLQSGAVKYIIVPTDPLGELFVTDRKYDDKKREDFIQALDSATYPMKKKQIGDLAIYQLDMPQELIYARDGTHIPYQKISQTEYALPNLSNVEELVFASGYDTDWVLFYEENQIVPKKYKKWFNSYALNHNVRAGVLVYRPQVFVYTGLIISGMACILIISMTGLVWLSLRKKRGFDDTGKE